MRRAGEGLRIVKAGSLEGRDGLLGRLAGLSAECAAPLVFLPGSLADLGGLRVCLAEPTECRDGLRVVLVAPQALLGELRVLVVLVALRAGLSGLLVRLDGLLVRLAGLRGGLKLRARGTGTGREAKTMATPDARRDGPKDGDTRDTRDSIPGRMSGLGGKATCEGGQ